MWKEDQMKKKEENEGEQICISGECQYLRGIRQGDWGQRIQSFNEVFEVDEKIISIAKKLAHWGFKTRFLDLSMGRLLGMFEKVIWVESKGSSSNWEMKTKRKDYSWERSLALKGTKNVMKCFFKMTDTGHIIYPKGAGVMDDTRE